MSSDKNKLSVHTIKICVTLMSAFCKIAVIEIVLYCMRNIKHINNMSLNIKLIFSILYSTIPFFIIKKLQLNYDDIWFWVITIIASFILPITWVRETNLIKKYFLLFLSKSKDILKKVMN